MMEDSALNKGWETKDKSWKLKLHNTTNNVTNTTNVPQKGGRSMWEFLSCSLKSRKKNFLVLPVFLNLVF